MQETHETGFDPWVREISWGRKWQPTLVFFFFKKKLFIYFNWSIITLQYFDGSAIYQHESAIGIHVTRPS